MTDHASVFESFLERVWPPARRCREIEDEAGRHACYREQLAHFWEAVLWGRLWRSVGRPPRLREPVVPPWPGPDPTPPWGRGDPDPMPITPLPEPLTELLLTAVNPNSQLAGFARFSREKGVYLEALQRVEKGLEEALGAVRREIESVKALQS